MSLCSGSEIDPDGDLTFQVIMDPDTDWDPTFPFILDPNPLWIQSQLPSNRVTSSGFLLKIKNFSEKSPHICTFFALKRCSHSGPR